MTATDTATPTATATDTATPTATDTATPTATDTATPPTRRDIPSMASDQIDARLSPHERW